jgi:transposase InsO family protein
MRKHGLNARRRRKYIPTTRSNHGLSVCENILDRQFGAGKPGEKWMSDITYLRTSGAWVYLTMIPDLFDRKVIGWAFNDDMESGHTVIPALEMAVGNHFIPTVAYSIAQKPFVNCYACGVRPSGRA